MFPVVASPRFSVNVRRISQRLYFAEVDDPDEGLKASLLAALATVRMFPEAYPRTGVAQRRFTFEYRSAPYTVLYAFDGELITLHDIHFSRSARAAHWLTE
ncbi:DNA-directed RNA polymerase subunit beta [Arabiibacter massiliensis]|uniref:DNA-directed RNA polymerase subunit beta n=1 Tax=Arabiibacter massiliensis TaxID=1870985 RepID=UPI0009BA1FDE|nr:DNA-directed RNA polymerase subunit beta [Arabiibacter massiliensis]